MIHSVMWPLCLPEQQLEDRKDTLGHLKWHQKPTIRQMSLTLYFFPQTQAKCYKAEEKQNQSNNQEDASHNKILNSKIKETKI